MRVFISHSLADTAVAHELATSLQAEGIEAWADTTEIPMGSRWSDVIRAELDAADAFVLIIGAGSQHSAWVRYEMSEVLKRSWADNRKVIVPLIVGDAELPGYLRDAQALRIRPDDSPDLKQMLTSLGKPSGIAGVHRTEAGDERISRRLAELQSTAATMAETEGDD
jgi:hypothetical protein